MVKEIKLIEIFLYLKKNYLKEMKRKEMMWKILIVFLELNGEILYYYKLKIKKLVVYFFSKVDEVVDKEKRSVCWGII